MRPSFGAALLGMSSFGIWHITSILNYLKIDFNPINFPAADP
jgi:hypothetical protein